MPVIDAATVFTPVTAAVPAATSTVRGTVELAVGSEFAANATNDTDATTPAYVAAAVTGRYLAQATAPTSPSAGLTWKNTSTQTVSGVGGGASAIWSGSTWSPFTFGSAKFVPNAVTTIAAAATFTPVNVALSGTPAINEDFAVASGTRVSAGAGLYLVGGQAVFTVVTGSAAASTLGQAIMAAAFRKNGTDYVGP